MLLAIVVLAILLLFNALFAMSELAMMTSRPQRLQASAAKGHGGAALALTLAREPTRFLSTVQVGITAIGIFAGAYGEKAISATLTGWMTEAVPMVAPYASKISLVVVVLCITYLSLVVGELVPKRIALSNPELIASTIARPLTFLSVIAAWPVKLLSLSTDAIIKILGIKPPNRDDISEDDVKSLVSRAAGTGVFDPLEHKLFQRLFRIGELTVASLMVPRSDIVWIDESLSSEDVKVLVGSSPYSHFPVCRGNIDTLVGVIHIKDLIAYGLLSTTEFKIKTVAQKPVFVPDTMPALRLLDRFQSTKTHVAFVVDEFGGTQGLITLNDVVQSLVGDLSRKGEEKPPAARQRTDGSWLIDGRLPVPEVVTTLAVAHEFMGALPDAKTAAGLMLGLLGHIPHEGETVLWGGWVFEVVDMDGARIDQLLVRKATPALPEVPAVKE